MDDRQIFDGVIIANELVDMQLREKRLGILFKIDMEKDYDSVDWNFVSYHFDRMGFGPRWKRWMRACIEGTTYSVLVNGSPTPR